MYTQGFVPSSSDAITIGKTISASVAGTTVPLTTTYIYVGTGGGGDIVWQNSYGDLNWLPGVVAGQTYIMGATKIVASGTVNGTSRTTTASNLTFLASNSIS